MLVGSREEPDQPTFLDPTYVLIHRSIGGHVAITRRNSAQLVVGGTLGLGRIGDAAREQPAARRAVASAFGVSHTDERALVVGAADQPGGSARTSPWCGAQSTVVGSMVPTRADSSRCDNPVLGPQHPQGSTTGRGRRYRGAILFRAAAVEMPCWRRAPGKTALCASGNSTRGTSASRPLLLRRDVTRSLACRLQRPRALTTIRFGGHNTLSKIHVMETPGAAGNRRRGGSAADFTSLQTTGAPAAHPPREISAAMQREAVRKDKLVAGNQHHAADLRTTLGMAARAGRPDRDRQAGRSGSRSHRIAEAHGWRLPGAVQQCQRQAQSPRAHQPVRRHQGHQQDVRLEGRRRAREEACAYALTPSAQARSRSRRTRRRARSTSSRDRRT